MQTSRYSDSGDDIDGCRLIGVERDPMTDRDDRIEHGPWLSDSLAER